MKKLAAILTGIGIVATLAGCPKPTDPNVPSSVTPPPAVTSSAAPTR